MSLLRVYRVEKSYRNGVKVVHLVVTAQSEEEFDDRAQCVVEDWAEVDTAGQNYGYDLRWEVETDQKLIHEAIEKEMLMNERKINNLSQRNALLNSHLKAKEQSACLNIDFEMFKDLYGSYVQMNDRFETVHIWSEELALTNKGRFTPILISKNKYETEKTHSWNN